MLTDFLDLLRRRAPLVLGVIVLGFAASWHFGLGQRAVFQSVETLRIAPPRIDPNLATTTVSEPLAQQLPEITRIVLSDTALAEIAKAYELFPDDAKLTPAEQAALLKDAVDISLATDDLPIVSVIAYWETAQEAQLVAQELSHRLINTAAQSRIAQAGATLDFLLENEQALQADLWTLQSRYEAFRQANVDLLEGRDAVLRSELNALNDAIVSIDRERLALETNPDPTRFETLTRQRDALVQQREAVGRNLLVPSGFIAELNAFERELTRIGAELSRASTRRARAETGLEVEIRRQSERLVVVSPAYLPERTVMDTKGILLALGGGVSTLFAFLLALALDQRNPVLRSPAQMKRLTGITPIAAVPRMAVQETQIAVNEPPATGT